ncbi:CaiB/BaiF CoA transferase family protein [Flavobacterium johnsoniae]|jgi:crotonobetainyl-CoA:carnitine CoA-transferase CaiB-like acyl-CoA transferase|uniref:L-carnitine dehydratase/bile acid-inducible protein F n=1 Tax=Flavobacterium johnsoniae (strain ATCC 17061 / DSM 2064 / JCM 8514 / BCRC 14874 / CCUG 350202 / NBRC 14942 / NCIMB 11054 / UW101) TaxID=376686 RepID=A5FCE2_FLAJ1|nr:CaiB/BaiF CoA-transferase family protein [Flavobacterium johnsoniae]ABQ07132.1 L-carnitine dehydratase/bile acid-inducible protein F [Flavobacterium johnsoniae UW101]OXE98848.1 CoA transferase [Flavobacterium johnsoniae UW101]WQG81029.1 CaiB/BaiF CoA-transferase family protein [Flavobacterium johnsoniae UW101]SHL29421.1 Crotonobetainyl-CoA:carnitine CoA-transferase CaiB [Flavobacterium johnsoniae]
MKPLEDYLIVDFSQFLSGPSASLRLADLGARVIKIEKPGTGDICRTLYTSDLIMNGESSVFHTINRNKESFAIDFKQPEELQKLKKLLAKADVVMHNFRPGVMERIGLSYDDVKAINPTVVYASISGFGNHPELKDLPGQDLLLQSLTALTWLSGNQEDGPVPMGLSIVDMLAGAHLAQGILAALYRKASQNIGGTVQVSMLESAFDFQFETITTFFNDGGELPVRTKTNNAHAYLGAPYGIYETKNGYLALAMGSIPVLASLLKCDELLQFPENKFTLRDEIKNILASHLLTQETQFWLDILEPADIWCAGVLNYEQLFKEDGFKVLEFTQQVEMLDGYSYKTTRCPIKIDGEYFTSTKGSPKLGQDNERIIKEFIA